MKVNDEILDEMISAACSAVPDLYRVDAMRAIEAALKLTADMSKATEDVLAERQRQIEAEGWTEEHDDRHDDRSLALAGSCYAQQYVGRAWLLEAYSDGEERYQLDKMPDDWPDSWDEEWWKPKNPRRDLVRAAALLIAEIERLDRAALKTAKL